jgi:type I site-specific restriction endonuclease
MKIINLSVREVKQINPDYIIVDEFHRCGADEWGIGVNMLINSFPEAKLIGTTATHIRYLDDKRNMADELFDGNIANHLTLSKALALNILPIPKYVSALYKFNDEYLRVKKSIADSLSDDKKVILERLNKIKLEFENTQSIPHILQEHLTGDIQKIIVFCKDIKHLRKHKSMVIEWFNAIGYSHINSYEVHSENDLKNKVIFNEFEHNHDKSLNIMFSVNILNEGVHIKGVNCIIMLRDTESPIIYYQQLGRCLVVGGEKPLIFDLVNNFANIRHRNLENETNAEFKRQEEIYKSKGIPYTEINFEIFDRVRNIKELLDDVEQTADSWQVFIVKLKNHINNFGNSYISNSHKDKWLVNKVRTIRANFKDGNLEKDKIEELNKLNFIWDAHIYKWELFIYKLKKYKEEFGHCNVNFDYEDQWLYTKVLNIRQQFQKGILEAEKIIELNNINFSWLSYSIDWKEFIEKLIKFKKEFGHCIIPYDFKDKKFYNTNIYIKHGFIKPTNEKVKKQLLKLGYEYNISDENVPNSSDNYWYSKYYKLKSFYEINGHCRVPRQGHILSNWVKRQRVNYKNDRLSEDKKKLLEEINFNTTTLYLNWISKFNSLKSFYEKNGTIEGISNKELRMWCSEQRKYYKSGTLEKEKIFLLESLNFIWCYYDASWEKNFSLLEIYKAEHGTTKVNKNHKLANWYFRQIRNFRDGNISEKRLLKLKSIGFEF